MVFKKDSRLKTFFNKEEEFYKAPFVIVVTEKMSWIFDISFVQ
jgi:outer membrane lipoprotein-sorting protein